MSVERMPLFEREDRSNQRESEPSFHRDMDEHSSYVLQKFTEAGFDRNGLPLSSPEFENVSMALHRGDSLTPTALIFLKHSLTNKDVRQAFANGLFLKSNPSNAEAVMDEVNRLSLKKGREDGNALAFSDLIKGLEKESGVNIDEGKSYAHFAWLGVRILQSDSLFNLFSGSGMRLAEFLGKYFSGHEFHSLRGVVDDILMQECRLDEGRGKKLFEGQDESFLLELADHTKQLDWGESLPKDPEEKMPPSFPVLDKKYDWAGRITLLYEVLKSPLVFRKTPERKLLDRVRRRENPLHPLVTLGVARTVGYEVEYPETDRVRKLSRNGTFAFLERLGFKESTAGSDCRETSPGPFYDPLTANLVFEKFADAKIVDLDKYEGMTMHFNVGLEGSRGLVELVRAMYLTGAGYDPNVDFRRSGLCIRSNSNGFGQYVECKTFDVMEKGEFVWNMRCLSYLSWALGAHQDLVGQGEENTWTKELAEIWMEYLGELNDGLKPVGLEGYLSEEENGANSVQVVHQELGRILPDTASRHKVEKRKGNLPSIKFDNREWPNVAAFARRVTELSVRKIEALADKIEKEAIQDARATETNHKYERFLQKYGTPISSSSSNSRKQVFNEVCDLLLKNI